MFNENIPSGRMKAWLIASVTAPVAVFAGGSSWTAVLTAVLVCGVVNMAVLKYCKKKCETNEVIAAVEWLWLGVLLGGIAGCSGSCWPEGSAYPVVPLILILLGCISARRGGVQASKVGAVLIWFVVFILGLAVSAGIKDIKTEWLRQQEGSLKLILIPLLLTPCLSIFMPQENLKPVRQAVLWICAAAVIVSFWINAAMSQQIAAQMDNPLYEYSKSISLMGTVKRFESVVSCAITVGWYCLFSLILSAAGHIAENARAGWGKQGVWGCGIAASAGLLTGQIQIGADAAAVCTVLWVLVPVLSEWSEKRYEKKKK